MSSGAVVYQVVDAPAGAIITTLPAGCQNVNVGNAAYSQCGTTYYSRVSNGYQVVGTELISFRSGHLSHR